MLPPDLVPGVQVRVHPSGAPAVLGRLEAVEDGWLRIAGSEGPHFVPVTQIASVLIYPGHGEQVVSGERSGMAKPREKELVVAPGSKVPARPWSDEDLRRLADAFLEHVPDHELAERMHRTRGQITTLHHAFECARGNRNEDDCSPAAQAWLPRLRKVLGRR